VTSEIAETAIVYPGTELGEGCRVLDYAVVGKQPTLGPRSTTSREELPALRIGAGTVVSTAAVVFAGSRIGAGVIVGDQACVRERCEIGDAVVIVTAHSAIDYADLVERAHVVVDLRNATGANGAGNEKVWKL
jgi:UDP-3-O-[3-hydroxymyristoyl] glucosamine N-acyltransferase